MRPFLALLCVTSALPACARAVGAQLSEAAPPTVGLALSGGSAKGFAHIGVLRTLERLGVEVDVVAGTSMGAVIGGLYAIGLSVDSIEHIISDADWSSLVGDGIPRRRLFLDQRRLDERTILSVPLEERRLTLPAGAIVGSNVMRTLEHSTWRAATVRRFADLPRPFVAMATDLETGEAVTLDEGVLSEVIRASSGVPGAVEPFLLDGRLLVDGALSRNLPASDARDLGADFVICSDVSEPIDSAEELRSIVDVLTQLASLSMLGTTLRQRELCDVLILPDVEGMSGLDFGRVDEWVERGVEATSSRAVDLRGVAASQAAAAGPQVTPDTVPGLLGDSVLITRIAFAGTEDLRVVELVRRELELEAGAYVGREQMEDRLGDLDATGLFGLVRYRLGVGLRYDDERRAALLFTASVHNLMRYGSLTRVDLRVGEETEIGLSFNRRRGVTGGFGVGLAARWSQAPLSLSPEEGGRVDVEVTRASLSLGLGAGRATYLALEAGAERTVSSTESADGWLMSGTAILDVETLDRVDFPRSGADLSARLEWGGTDVVERGWFSVWIIEARSFVHLHPRVSFELGGFAGYARGPDVPAHRRFFLGGAHRSAVFRSTHPGFQGLESQEQSGRAVQVGRAGLRVEVRPDVFVRAGVDVGGVRDEWALPMERPMTGWALAAGARTRVGPVELEISQLWANRDPRVSVSVGRQF